LSILIITTYVSHAITHELVAVNWRMICMKWIRMLKPWNKTFLTWRKWNIFWEKPKFSSVRYVLSETVYFRGFMKLISMDFCQSREDKLLKLDPKHMLKLHSECW